jgi:hypothetical protein
MNALLRNTLVLTLQAQEDLRAMAALPELDDLGEKKLDLLANLETWIAALTKSEANLLELVDVLLDRASLQG